MTSPGPQRRLREPVPAREWTDDDGVPLGSWVTVSREEYQRLFAAAGGFNALTVFSTLTDPDGHYGPPRIYTAWGLPDDQVPILDVCDHVRQGRKEYRQFVPRDEQPLEGERE